MNKNPSIGDVLPGNTKKILKWAAIGVGGLIALNIVFGSIVSVPTGFRGIKFTFGKAQETVMTEGVNFLWPVVQKYYLMPVTIQRAETSTDAASKDLQQVSTTVVLNYHLEPSQVVEVYRDLGVFENVENRIIDPTVQESVKAVTAKYTAEQLVTRREEVGQKIKDMINASVAKYSVVIDDFSITNFRFSEAFEKAVEEKTISDQARLRAEKELERTKIEVEKQVAEARAQAESRKLVALGEAEATRVAAEAQAAALKLQRDQITPQLIELRRVEATLRAIEKWDGRAPQMMGQDIGFMGLPLTTEEEKPQ